MSLKIVCFEDKPEDCEKLQVAFKIHNAEFRFFTDPQGDWNVTSEIAEVIEAFGPTFIIVDLKDNKRKKKEAGLRIIRQLNDYFKDRFPVIAWSVLLTDKPNNLYVNLARAGGAKILLKSRKKPSAARFISLANERG